MFFIIKSTSVNKDLSIYRAKRTAKLRLALFPKGATEALLNNYLETTYEIGLYAACQKILASMVFNLNLQGEIIASIPDNKLNEIARIITYGTGKLCGSRILKAALSI